MYSFDVRTGSVSGSWGFTFKFVEDGIDVDEVDKQIIDRDLDVSQFSISIDGIEVPLVGDIIWSGTELTLTVDLPDSSSAQVPTIASVYSIQVYWIINDLPADIIVDTSTFKPNHLTYHDLEVVYSSDDIDLRTYFALYC